MPAKKATKVAKAAKSASGSTRAKKFAAGKFQAWEHQQQTKTFLSDKAWGFDFSDPGTGKTAGQIMVFQEVKAQLPDARWLVVSPKTLMETAWGGDIRKFAPELSIAYAYAPDATRRAAFESGADVVVINSDGVKWLADNMKLLKGFVMLTIDEITTYKNGGNTQRTKAMRKVSKVFKRRYGLTGTPNPNTVMELFYPTLILDGGETFGTAYSRLRMIVQEPVQTGPLPEHVTWVDTPGANDAVHAQLAPHSIRHRFEDVMPHVPPNHRSFREFELSPKAMRMYKAMASEARLAFEGGEAVGVHAAALRNKLLQIASGAVYRADGEYEVICRKRYEMIAEMLEEREQSVVFFNWAHQRDLLLEHFRKMGMSTALIDGSVTNAKVRNRLVEEFQNGEHRIFLLHPRTGAHGLTLTAGTTTVFSSPIYEADLVEQGLRRIYRGVQDKVTNTIFVEALKTDERLVYERVWDKNLRMQDMLSLLSYQD